MGILVVSVNFTNDEAEFLSSLLARWTEVAPAGSAERFWLERLHNRVHQEMVDVVANDSAARLAASSMLGPLPPPPPPPAAAPFPGVCACGNTINSKPCLSRRMQGIHP